MVFNEIKKNDFVVQIKLYKANSKFCVEIFSEERNFKFLKDFVKQKTAEKFYFLLINDFSFLLQVLLDYKVYVDKGIVSEKQNNIVLTDRQREIVENLRDTFFTIDNLELLMNESAYNTVSAEARGYYRAVLQVEKNTKR